MQRKKKSLKMEGVRKMKRRWILWIVLGVAFLFAAATVKATASTLEMGEIGQQSYMVPEEEPEEETEEEMEVQPEKDELEEEPEEATEKQTVSGNIGVSGNGAEHGIEHGIEDGVEDGIEEEPVKTMYLTFDDGPTEEYTNMVLDTLQKYHIRATFFVVGENVRKHPEVARRIVAEGHTVGIHCNNHDYNTLYQSADSYIADFEEACLAVKEVMGVETKLFRFPGGSVNAYNKSVRDEIIRRMDERGYIYVDWNASLEDAVSNAKPEKLIRNARETTLGRKKVIMLAHDRVRETAACLDDLIVEFLDYKMEPLSPAVEPIQF